MTPLTFLPLITLLNSCSCFLVLEKNKSKELVFYPNAGPEMKAEIKNTPRNDFLLGKETHYVKKACFPPRTVRLCLKTRHHQASDPNPRGSCDAVESGAFRGDVLHLPRGFHLNPNELTVVVPRSRHRRH